MTDRTASDGGADDSGNPARGSVWIGSRDGAPTAVLVGEIDLAAVQAAPDDAIDASCAGRPLVIDLAGTTFMDSAGMALLVRLRSRAASARVVAPSPRIARLLELTGLAEAFGLE